MRLSRHAKNRREDLETAGTPLDPTLPKGSTKKIHSEESLVKKTGAEHVATANLERARSVSVLLYGQGDLAPTGMYDPVLSKLR
jgi:hypothetical protein